MRGQAKRPPMEVEEIERNLVQFGEMPEDYFPARYGKALPEKGGWIMLLTALDVGKPLPDGNHEAIHVPHLSIWFATPTATNFTRDFRGTAIALAQAIIQTPQGPVHVWPHEYNVVDLTKYLEFGEEEGFYIHFLQPETGGFDPQKLHYLRSRGISKTLAQKWLLPELKNPFFCYFTLNEEYSNFFGDGCGIPRLRIRRASEEKPR